MGGFLLSALPSTVFAVGSGNVAQAAAVVSTVSLLSAVSAAGSLLLARVAEDRELLAAGDEVSDVGLTGEEARELLGGASGGAADS